jgi:hypothetical protein
MTKEMAHTLQQKEDWKYTPPTLLWKNSLAETQNRFIFSYERIS